MILVPKNGGGTPYLEPDSPGSYSSDGVFGGLGGGGGPWFDTDDACGRDGALSLIWAYLPAPSNGGGAAKRGGYKGGQKDILNGHLLKWYIQVDLWEVKVLLGGMAPSSQVRALEQSFVLVEVLEELLFPWVLERDSLTSHAKAAPQVEVVEGEPCFSNCLIH